MISVVIPNHNYKRFLPEVFASLAAQSVGAGRLDVVFVDDASDDGSADEARRLGADAGFARFEVVELSRVGRPGPVRNKGLARTRGRFAACIDPDDLLLPDHLARCLAALEADPAVSYAYTDYVHREGGEDKVAGLPEYDPNLLRQQNIVPPTALMRRSLVRDHPGYRANTDYEDWDFWVCAAQLGHAGVLVPEPLYVHRVHGGNFSQTARQNDGRAKAAIVLNNRPFFDEKTVHWAREHLRGAAWANGFLRGLIPRPEDVEKLMRSG